MTEKKNEPEVIRDEDLDEASGGIHLLVPAVQGVCDASAKSGTATSTAFHSGGVNVALADGSVR